MLLLAMVLDGMVRSEGDIVHSAAMEILTRRIHGLQRAFRDVRKMSDWKQPGGQHGQNWRSKVQWHLCDQYDFRALDEEDMAVGPVVEEVRKRLETKGLCNKYLSKAEGQDSKGRKNDD